MILRKTRVIFQTHDPQGGRDGSFSWYQNRSDQQDLRLGPRCHAIEAWRKWVQQVYDYGGQVGHVLSFARGSKQLSLPSLF
jgi:hypothetical protein